MTNLPPFNVPGVRASIENLIEHLQQQPGEAQRFQVEIQAEEIIGQMQRLLRPTYRPDKGAESLPPVVPAEQMGIPPERVQRVQGLVSGSVSAYLGNNSPRAVELAEEALSAWDT